MPTAPTLRPGTPADAPTIAALAIQVFLDTYATGGIRPDLAREALRDYGVAAFQPRLREPQRRVLLAELAPGAWDAAHGMAKNWRW